MKNFFGKLIAKLATLSKRTKIISAIVAVICCGGIITGVAIAVSNGGSDGDEQISASQSVEGESSVAVEESVSEAENSGEEASSADREISEETSETESDSIDNSSNSEENSSDEDSSSNSSTDVEVHIHAFLTPKKDANYHWMECSCGESAEKASHAYTANKDNVSHWEECTCGDISNKVAHSYVANKDDNNHWEECTCGAISGKTEHSFTGNACTCGQIKATEGLAYTLSADRTCYSVTGIGTTTERNIVIPSTHNGLPVTAIGDGAFLEGNINSIVIPDSVTSIGMSAFYHCTHLMKIEVGENNTKYKSIDGDLYSKDGKTLVQYAVGKVSSEFTIPNHVLSIGSYAFASCRSLTSVNIGSVVSIGEGAFEECYFTNIVIPDSVESIDICAFAGCKFLASVTIGKNVTFIGRRAFSSCKLTSIIIPDSVKTIEDEAFSHGKDLTNVTIGTGVTKLGGYVFYNCSSLTSVTFKNISDWSGTEKYGDAEVEISSVDITDPTQAAQLLKDTYVGYIWTKMEA